MRARRERSTRRRAIGECSELGHCRRCLSWARGSKSSGKETYRLPWRTSPYDHGSTITFACFSGLANSAKAPFTSASPTYPVIRGAAPSPPGHEVLWRAIEAGALRGGIGQSGVPV